MFKEVNQAFAYPNGPVVNPEMETFYIAGPISGDLVGNMPPFFEAEAELLAMGHAVFNPGRIDGASTAREAVDLALANKRARSWHWYMRRCLAGLTRCTALVALPGWERSEGATVEVQTAIALGLPVTELDEADLSSVPELAAL